MLKEILRRYFIPHEENGYQPHILQKTAVAAMLCLVVMSFTIANVQSIILVSSQWFISTILPSVLVDLTNKSRSGEALGMLTRSPLLDEAARLKAEDMARGSYFAHESPEGLSPWHWFREVGYEYANAGENLAVHFSDSKEVVDAWMNSPGHRANILDEDYTEIGIGTAEGTYKGHSTVFVVQLFARPAVARSIVFPPPVAEAAPAEFVVDATSSPVVLSDTDAPFPSDTMPLVATTTEGNTEDVPHTVMYSGISTTSGLMPTDVTGNTQTYSGGVRSFFERLATQPTTVLSILYTAIALFVVACLALSIAIEWRRQHPVQIAYGTGLLAVMGVMWYVHHLLMAGAVIA